MNIKKALSAPFHVVKNKVDDVKQEKERKETPFHYPENLSEADFEALALETAQSFKGLAVVVKNQFVYVTVPSPSGITTWNFKADFNDFGTITGKHWITSENFNSAVPKNYSDKLEKNILAFLNKE